MLKLGVKYKPKNKESRKQCGSYCFYYGEYIIFHSLSSDKKCGLYDIFRKGKIVNSCSCLEEEDLVLYEERTLKKLNSY